MFINFLFFARDSDLHKRTHADLGLLYKGEVFGSTSGYIDRLTYRISDSSFGLIGPTLSPDDTFTWGETGRIISYLDFAGATLIVIPSLGPPDCNENFRVEKLYISTSSSLELEIPTESEQASHRNLFRCVEIIPGGNLLAYGFDPDAENFLRIYARQR